MIMEEEKPRFLPRTTNSNKVVPMRRGSGMEVSLIKPTSLDDAKEICDYLLAGKAVVLNMEESTPRPHSGSSISHPDPHIP